jgi:hypothetical protein
VQPFEFIAGQAVSNRARKIDDSAGGLFSGVGGPKPPQALSTAVLGMKTGGKASAGGAGLQAGWVGIVRQGAQLLAATRFRRGRLGL